MLRLGQLEALERAAGRNCYCEALLNRACKLLKFVSMVSMFLTISGDKQNNCCNGA